MNSEKLMNAIGLLDDNVLRGTQIDAQVDVQVSPIKKSKVIYFRIAAVAASLILILLMAVVINNSMKAPVENNDEPLIAVVEDTLPPQDEVIVTTEEPQVTMEPVETKDPVQNNVENAERNESDREVYNVQTSAPEVQVTEGPLVSYPENNYDVSEEEKPVQDEEIKEENSSAIPEVTEAPGITEEPEDDDAWTQDFVVNNVEHNEGTDKTVAFNFVEQLYFSTLSDIPSFKAEKHSSWWYGLKVGDYLYTQAEVNIQEDYIDDYISESMLKGINRTDYTSRETKAYAYGISGVAKEAAIAVKIDEQEGYYLFVNTDYRANSLKEFVQAYNLEEYSTLNALAVYDEGNAEVFENVDDQRVWETLTFGEEKYVNYKALYLEYEVAATIEMDAELYGYMDVPIALYDEGYVVIYLGDINGAYYVGPEIIALIRGMIIS